MKATTGPDTQHNVFDSTYQTPALDSTKEGEVRAGEGSDLLRNRFQHRESFNLGINSFISLFGTNPSEKFENAFSFIYDMQKAKSSSIPKTTPQETQRTPNHSDYTLFSSTNSNDNCAGNENSGNSSSRKMPAFKKGNSFHKSPASTSILTSATATATAPAQQISGNSIGPVMHSSSQSSSNSVSLKDEYPKSYTASATNSLTAPSKRYTSDSSLKNNVSKPPSVTVFRLFNTCDINHLLQQMMVPLPQKLDKINIAAFKTYHSKINQTQKPIQKAANNSNSKRFNVKINFSSEYSSKIQDLFEKNKSLLNAKSFNSEFGRFFNDAEMDIDTDNIFNIEPILKLPTKRKLHDSQQTQQAQPAQPIAQAEQNRKSKPKSPEPRPEPPSKEHFSPRVGSIESLAKKYHFDSNSKDKQQGVEQSNKISFKQYKDNEFKTKSNKLSNASTSQNHNQNQKQPQSRDVVSNKTEGSNKGPGWNNWDDHDVCRSGSISSVSSSNNSHISKSFTNADTSKKTRGFGQDLVSNHTNTMSNTATTASGDRGRSQQPQSAENSIKKIAGSTLTPTSTSTSTSTPKSTSTFAFTFTSTSTPTPMSKPLPLPASTGADAVSQSTNSARLQNLATNSGDIVFINPEREYFSAEEIDLFEEKFSSCNSLARRYKHQADKFREKNVLVALLHYFEACNCFAEGFWYAQLCYPPSKAMENWGSLIQLCKFVNSRCKTAKGAIFSNITALSSCILATVSYQASKVCFSMAQQIDDSIKTDFCSGRDPFVDTNTDTDPSASIGASGDFSPAPTKYAFARYKKLVNSTNEYLLESETWFFTTSLVELLRPANLSSTFPDLWNRCLLPNKPSTVSSSKHSSQNSQNSQTLYGCYNNNNDSNSSNISSTGNPHRKDSGHRLRELLADKYEIRDLYTAHSPNFNSTSQNQNQTQHQKPPPFPQISLPLAQTPLAYPISSQSSVLDVVAFTRQALRELVKTNNIREFRHLV